MFDEINRWSTEKKSSAHDKFPSRLQCRQLKKRAETLAEFRALFSMVFGAEN